MAKPSHALIKKQLPAFGATGAIGFVVNIAVTTAVKDGFGFPVEIAYLAGYSSALIIGFMICRHYVFKTASQSAGRQMALFLVSSLFFRSTEYLASLLLNKGMEIHYLLSLFIVTISAFFLKFIYYRKTVFKPTTKQ